MKDFLNMSEESYHHDSGQMKCSVYTRASTDNQAGKEYNSCKAQEEKIKAYIRIQENLKLCKVYNDAGFSGASLDIPALKEMLNDIKSATNSFSFLLQSQEARALAYLASTRLSYLTFYLTSSTFDST